jgi:hypothetical protein
MPRLSTYSLTRVTGKLYRVILCRFEHRLLNTVNVNELLRTWSAIFDKIEKLRSKLQIFYLFVVYFATLLVAHTIQRHTVGENDAEGCCRSIFQASIAVIRVKSRHYICLISKSK